MNQPESGSSGPSERRPVTEPWAAIQRIAHRLDERGFSRGDLAALRRIEPSKPGGSAFWKLLISCVPQELRATADDEECWALIMNGMAIMAPYHHRRGERLGHALAKAGLLEQRLNRLLRERGDGFRAAVPRLCRFLAVKAMPIDWVELGRLVLAHSDEYAEPIRRHIAADYFTALQQREKREG